MAYYNTFQHAQFLDLSGVNEDEKKWLLNILQENCPAVEGPWSKDNEMIIEPPTSQPECTIQTNMNNGLPAISYEQYPSPPVILSNHVSPISAQVYPQSYQAPIPIYPPAFVPQVPYPASITMVPVNAPMMSFPGQPVTYATYPPPIQANPICNMPPPAVKEPPAAKINMSYNMHHHSDHQSPVPEYCHPVHLPPTLPMHPHHKQHIHTSHSSPILSHSQQQQQSHHSADVSNKPILQPAPPAQPPLSQQAIANGPMRGASPVDTAPLVTNGYDATQHTAHTKAISANLLPPASSNSISGPHTSPGKVVENAPAAISVTAAAEVSGGGGGTMSWASLFNKKNNAESAPRPEIKTASNGYIADRALPVTDDKKIVCAAEENLKKSPLAEIGDPNYFRMGEILMNYMPDNKITSLQPRGLINRSNYCYINSILQALLACPPMYNLLYALGQNVTNDFRKHSQIIDTLVKFVKEFNHLPSAQRVSRRSDKVQKKEQTVVLAYDRPFEPNWVYKMLNGMRSDSFVVEGRQEDAEEFLGCLLNGLNDEMLELMKLVGAEDNVQETVVEDGYKSDSEREWHVIGPKNKGCITRRTEIVRTPISDIFGGNIRSKLHRTGDQITNNIQPFFTLQLNIEKVNTVREALEALVCKNQLEGVTSSKTNEEVEAWQQVTIEELPVVLILHLKCFDFKMDGCTKIVKALEFPVDLKIDAKLLSQKTNYQPKEKQYKLFAVVYHDGKEATKGHYLTDAYHVGYASWLRFDDSSVKAVQEEQVLKPHGTRVPYLLFYRRCDTVRSK